MQRVAIVIKTLNDYRVQVDRSQLKIASDALIKSGILWSRVIQHDDVDEAVIVIADYMARDKRQIIDAFKNL